jgi:hypothetical protein
MNQAFERRREISNWLMEVITGWSVRKKALNVLWAGSFCWTKCILALNIVIDIA